MICYPDKVHSFSYNGSRLFYSAGKQKLVNVNQYGAAILTIAKNSTGIDNIVRKCAEQFDLPADEIRTATIDFLRRMTDNGFLGDEIDNRNGEVISAPKQTGTGVVFKELYLHLTNECNLSCWYCYNKDFRISNEHQADLMIDEFEQIITQFSELGGQSIIFTGGEPLLFPPAIALARLARTVGLQTSLLTNGTLCNAQNAPEICKCFNQIIVSLDSKYPEEHEALRGKDSFARTVAGIKCLSGFLRENPSETTLYCRPVITKNNIRNILEYPEFMINELGCSRAMPNSYVPNELSDFDSGNFLSFQEINSCLVKFHSILDKLGGITSYDFMSLKNCSRCSAGNAIISIAPDGSIYPCQSLHNRNVSLGNIRDGRLDHIVEKSAVSKFFREFHHSQIATCKDCGLGSLCGGGCRAIAYNYYLDLNAYNEIYCPFLRQGLEFGLWLKSLEEIWDRNVDNPIFH